MRKKSKNQQVLTVMVTIAFDSKSQPCLSESKSQINIVIHNFKLNGLAFIPSVFSFGPFHLP